MTSVNVTFKEKFENDYDFIIINNSQEINLRIINNVDHFYTFKGHIIKHEDKSNIFLCKHNEFINAKKCNHCNENIKVIDFIFITCYLCDNNGNIINDKPKIWILPNYKFDDIFIPFHKSFKGNDYHINDYIFNVHNINKFYKIKYKHKKSNVTLNDLNLNECIHKIMIKYKD